MPLTVDERGALRRSGNQASRLSRRWRIRTSIRYRSRRADDAGVRLRIRTLDLERRRFFVCHSLDGAISTRGNLGVHLWNRCGHLAMARQCAVTQHVPAAEVD